VKSDESDAATRKANMLLERHPELCLVRFQTKLSGFFLSHPPGLEHHLLLIIAVTYGLANVRQPMRELTV
jgi:hypothetical protein